MTDAVPITAELTTWLEGWEKCTQIIIAQITGQPVAFAASPNPLPVAESDLWFLVTAGGAIRGEMSLRLPSASGIRLAQRFLQELDSAPDTPTADHKEALEELLRQIAGQAATSLAPVAGGELQFHVAASGPPTWSPSGIRSLDTRDEAGTPVTIEFQVSAALTTALPVQSAPTPIPSTLSSPATTPSAPANPRYERLRDVILDIKLRFGSRRMLLRDVLALSAGVVVELDSSVTAPVDLLLDGRVVAQGDVVVVDGKYGLRVTQVLDPIVTTHEPPS